jgi:acyl-CoA synthetase (NDP forming)
VIGGVIAGKSDAISVLLAPRSVAVIGASADASKTSGLPVQFLRKQGFSGAIYPVNPRVSNIDGLTCFPDTRALPAPPDVGLVLLGAERAVQAVRDLAEAGTKAAIVVASGFGETGEAGQRRQAALMAAAGSMRILGPNTIGLVNVTQGIPLSVSEALAAGHFPKGPVSIVSQSGGILGALLSRAAARGIGLAKLVSTSNEVDLDVADFIDHLADDAATGVIVLYLETIRNPETFRRAVIKAGRAHKPVVALKVGRSEAGARAAVSHTGAMAGSDVVYDAFFHQLGIIRAQSFSDLLDIPAVLATQPTLRGKRIAILTSTGGAATLLSDSLGIAGLEIPDPDAATVERLRAVQPGDQAVLDRNPIDVTLAGLRPDILRGVIHALAESPTFDAFAIIVGSSGVARPDLISDAIAAAMPVRTKPVVAYISPHAPEAVTRLTELGVPTFTAPEGLASSLSALWRASNLRDPEPPIAKPPRVPALDDLEGALDEAAAKQLFARFAVPCVRETIVSTPQEAERAAREFQGRVVLKILSAEIMHKSDVGGVAVDLSTETIGARLIKMKKDVLAATGSEPGYFLVQDMIDGAVELILGFRRDHLGDTILLGQGGVTAELIRDTTIRLMAPGGGLSESDAMSMPRGLKIWPLLDGFRGRPKADVNALAKTIVDFSEMVAQLGPRLIEAEINPLFVLPQGKGVIAADGVAVLAMRTCA